jgi:hypothetical protein
MSKWTLCCFWQENNDVQATRGPYLICSVATYCKVDHSWHRIGMWGIASRVGLLLDPPRPVLAPDRSRFLRSVGGSNTGGSAHRQDASLNYLRAGAVMRQRAGIEPGSTRSGIIHFGHQPQLSPLYLSIPTPYLNNANQPMQVDPTLLGPV